MENAGTCCGLGGTYSVYHYENSKRIGAAKAGNIETSGAELVATDCPGCIMQLQDSINHAGGRQRVVHILELLNEALPD
jgi:glycolate oxidase iron-sulfur subunit